MVPAHLQNGAEIEQGVAIVGCLRQRMAIGRLGFLQAALAQKIARNAQGVGKGHRVDPVHGFTKAFTEKLSGFWPLRCRSHMVS